MRKVMYFILKLYLTARDVEWNFKLIIKVSAILVGSLDMKKLFLSSKNWPSLSSVGQDR